MIRLSRKGVACEQDPFPPWGGVLIPQDTEDHVATHRKASPHTLRKCWGPHGERPQAFEALTLCMTSREVATFPFPHSCNAPFLHTRALPPQLHDLSYYPHFG